MQGREDHSKGPQGVASVYPSQQFHPHADHHGHDHYHQNHHPASAVHRPSESVGMGRGVEDDPFQRTRSNPAPSSQSPLHHHHHHFQGNHGHHPPSSLKNTSSSGDIGVAVVGGGGSGVGASGRASPNPQWGRHHHHQHRSGLLSGPSEFPAFQRPRSHLDSSAFSSMAVPGEAEGIMRLERRPFSVVGIPPAPSQSAPPVHMMNADLDPHLGFSHSSARTSPLPPGVDHSQGLPGASVTVGGAGPGSIPRPQSAQHLSFGNLPLHGPPSRGAPSTGGGRGSAPMGSVTVRASASPPVGGEGIEYDTSFVSSFERHAGVSSFERHAAPVADQGVNFTHHHEGAPIYRHQHSVVGIPGSQTPGVDMGEGDILPPRTSSGTAPLPHSSTPEDQAPPSSSTPVALGMVNRSRVTAATVGASLRGTGGALPSHSSMPVMPSSLGGSGVHSAPNSRRGYPPALNHSPVHVSGGVHRGPSLGFSPQGYHPFVAQPQPFYPSASHGGFHVHHPHQHLTGVMQPQAHLHQMGAGSFHQHQGQGGRSSHGVGSSKGGHHSRPMMHQKHMVHHYPQPQHHHRHSHPRSNVPIPYHAERGSRGGLTSRGPSNSNSTSNFVGGRPRGGGGGGGGNSGRRGSGGGRGGKGSRGGSPAVPLDTPLCNIVDQIPNLVVTGGGCRYLAFQMESLPTESMQLLLPVVESLTEEVSCHAHGNYLLQTMIGTATREELDTIVSALCGDAEMLFRIASNMHGTRVVQKLVVAVGSLSRDEQSSNDVPPHPSCEIVKALRHYLVPLMKDPNGNHVVQRCLEKFTALEVQPVFDAIRESIISVATHRHGCCVIQRCIDHASVGQKAPLCEVITSHVKDLCEDPYGNYALQYVITHGSPVHRQKIVDMMAAGVVSLSCAKFSSNVVERCLTHGSPQQRFQIMSAVLAPGTPDQDPPLKILLQDCFANYVVQKLLDVANTQQCEVLAHRIRELIPTLHNINHIKHLVVKLLKMGHAVPEWKPLRFSERNVEASS